MVGEGGDEGMGSRGWAVRRLMVTLLDVGSGGGWSGWIRVGVRGGAASTPTFVLPLPFLPSRRGVEGTGGALSDSQTVSTDLLRDSSRETRCRFLEEGSSKGLGRVEQGSEETARSRESSAGVGSIWEVGGTEVGRREQEVS